MIWTAMIKDRNFRIGQNSLSVCGAPSSELDADWEFPEFK